MTTTTCYGACYRRQQFLGGNILRTPQKNPRIRPIGACRNKSRIRNRFNGEICPGDLVTLTTPGYEKKHRRYGKRESRTARHLGFFPQIVTTGD